jgi:hypothetical protein
MREGRELLVGDPDSVNWDWVERFGSFVEDRKEMG